MIDLVTLALPFLPRGASHADSGVVAARVAQTRHEEWVRFLEGWRDFFLMTGTAAVTLAGLLFVAISLHIEALIHESREHLLGLARAILFSFVMVLTMSLMLLMPAQSMRVTGAEMMMIGAIFAAMTLRQLRTGTTDHPDFPKTLFRRRLIPTLIGYAAIVAIGAALMVLRAPEALLYVMGAFGMLLGNAVGASWDLLVRTAKIKRRAGGGAG